MIIFPNCKINLGLRVLQKRADGFHNIETIFFPVPLRDALEIVPLQNSAEPSITSYGLPIPGTDNDNLCIKAWHLLKKDFPGLPPVQIHLLKNIPLGAGLGGGSSDGAFMLQLLNKQFHLHLSSTQLAQYALQLGSDCPFFILNQPCIATGRGEILESVPVHLSGYYLVLANPGINISTGWAFQQIIVNDSLMNDVSLKSIIAQPVETWKHELKNDFENKVFEKYPQVKALKENMYEMGAVYSAMSGSGSTVFGLFKNNADSLNELPPHYITVPL